MLKWKPIVLAGLLALGGCPSAGIEDKIVVACQGYAGALVTAADARAAGDLSEKQVATVEAVRAALNPICLEGQWADAATALAAVERGLANLRTLGGK